MTRIVAVRSAFPVHRYPQAEFTLKVAELSGLGPGPRGTGGLLRAPAHAAAPLPPQYFLRDPEYRCRATGKQLEFKPVSDQLEHPGYSFRRTRACFQRPGRLV